MLLRMFQFSRPPAADSLSVTEAYHQLVGPKGLPSGKRRNLKGRPFWSRVWVLASIPTERNALNG